MDKAQVYKLIREKVNPQTEEEEAELFASFYMASSSVEHTTQRTVSQETVNETVDVVHEKDTCRTKYCNRCGHDKLRTEFGRNGNKTDGLQDWCKDCFKDYYQARANGESTHRERPERQESMTLINSSVSSPSNGGKMPPIMLSLKL